MHIVPPVTGYTLNFKACNRARYTVDIKKYLQIEELNQGMKMTFKQEANLPWTAYPALTQAKVLITETVTCFGSWCNPHIHFWPSHVERHAHTDMEGKRMTALSGPLVFQPQLHQCPCTQVFSRCLVSGMGKVTHRLSPQFRQRKKQKTLKDRATEIKDKALVGPAQVVCGYRVIFKHPASLSSPVAPDKSQANTLDLWGSYLSAHVSRSFCQFSELYWSIEAMPEPIPLDHSSLVPQRNLHWDSFFHYAPVFFSSWELAKHMMT